MACRPCICSDLLIQRQNEPAKRRAFFMGKYVLPDLRVLKTITLRNNYITA